MKVAILGTGKMGNAVVRACSTRGIGVVVWNRTLSKALSLQAEGVQVADRAAAAIGAADAVVSNLLSGEALLHTLREEPARQALVGKTLIAMTSTSTSEARRLEALTLEMGAKAFLDVATISWPSEIAESRGKILVGCSHENFAAWEGFFGTFGVAERAGEVGSASAVEMAFFIQMSLHQYAYLSGRKLLERHMVSNDAFDRVVNNNSIFSSPLFGMYASVLRSREYKSPLYRLDRYRRLLGLISDDMNAAGMNEPVLAEIVKAADEAIAAYGPGADWTSMYECLQSLGTGGVR